MGLKIDETNLVDRKSKLFLRDENFYLVQSHQDIPANMINSTRVFFGHLGTQKLEKTPGRDSR